MPYFMEEGLAVWVGCDRALPELSELARRSFGKTMTSESIPEQLGLLFRSPNTYSACGEIAGNFTAFVIDRFGWSIYCEFYRRTSEREFMSSFEEVFAVPFHDAAELWRREKRIE